MTARPIRRNAQTPDRNGKIFYTSTTSLSHISKLKRGVSMTREYGKLKFDPIKFKGCHNDGTIGTKGHNRNFFRSALTQNIAYLIRDSYKSVNEIADELGVSPVYVESEVTYLEKYGFLQKKGEKYISSFIINVPDEHTIKLQDEVYSRATELIADELFDGLTESGLTVPRRT